METKYYTISWVSKPSAQPDNHGNYWYNLKLEGYEYNVAILAKNEPTVGQRIYGKVTKEEKKSKPGEHYYRFRKEQVPDTSNVGSPYSGTADDTPKEYQDEDRVGDILQLVKEIHKAVGAVSDYEERTERVAETFDVDTDEPVDLSEIPF